jgi:hypothetical protein
MFVFVVVVLALFSELIAAGRVPRVWAA